MNSHIRKITGELDKRQFKNIKHAKSTDIIEKFLFYPKYSVFNGLGLKIKRLFLLYLENIFKLNSTKFWTPYIALNITKAELQIFERFGHNPPIRPLSQIVIDDKGTWHGCRFLDKETRESKTIERILDKDKFLDLAL